MKIYKITNKINNKIYIGQTVKKIKARFQEHKHASKKEKYKHIKLYKAFKKYGIENFKIEEIDSAKNINCLNKKEIYWIKELNCMDDKFGYNMCLGGNNTKGRKCTKITKEKISKNAKKRYLEYGSHREISVGAFDNGNCVAKFKSFVSAAKFCKICESSIRQSLKTNIKIFGYEWRIIDKIDKENHENFKRKEKENFLLKLDPLTLEILEEMNQYPSNDLKKEVINNSEATHKNFRWVTKGNTINFKLYKYIIKKENTITEIPFINNINKRKILEFFNIKFFSSIRKNIINKTLYKGYSIEIKEYFVNKTF